RACGPSFRYTCSIGGGTLFFGSGALAMSGVRASRIASSRGSPAFGAGRARDTGRHRVFLPIFTVTLPALHFFGFALPLPPFFDGSALGVSPSADAGAARASRPVSAAATKRWFRAALRVFLRSSRSG